MKITLALFIFFSLLTGFKLGAETIKIASDEWCPYICNDEKQPGFLVETMALIAANENLTMQFELVPLSRALKLTEKSVIDITLALTRGHLANHNLIASTNSFGGFYNDFYALEQDSIRIESIADLESILTQKRTIAVINGYQYAPQIERLLLNYPNNVHWASGDSPLKTNLELLNKKRVELILDSRFTVQYQVKKSHIPGVRRVGSLGQLTPLYLGFSPTSSATLVKKFDEGLQHLRATGVLARLLQKYNSQDWLIRPHK